MPSLPGVIIGTAGLPDGELVLAILILVLIAACSVAIPVIAYLIASRTMIRPLESLRGWLAGWYKTVPP
jgi:hypothetical protein